MRHLCFPIQILKTHAAVLDDELAKFVRRREGLAVDPDREAAEKGCVRGCMFRTYVGIAILKLGAFIAHVAMVEYFSLGFGKCKMLR